MKQGNVEIKQVYYKGGLKLLLYRKAGALHNDNGPAYIRYSSGKVEMEMYLIDGVRHREDGPAVIRYDENGEVFYAENWIKGVRYGTTEDMKEYRRAI